jgi:transcription-repair coupling factor (superfamily II helicase)
VERLDAGPKGAVIGFRDNRFAKPDKLIGFIQRMAGAIKVRPDQKLVYARGWETPQDRVGGARKLVQRLADLAG